ncbi:hypothetical protein V8F20_010959 [Naviculisporaceae sp. PSN 640]
MPPLFPITSRLFSIIRVLFILLHLRTTAAQNNWSNFPYSSRSCLNHYTDLSSCPRTDIVSWNYCLCNNYENWMANVAACVNKEAPDDLETVYGQIVVVCAGTNTPTPYSLDDFMAAAAAGTNTENLTPTTTPITGTGTFESPPKQTQTSHTTTPTSTPEKEKSSGDGGLSTSDKIAIGIGVPVGVFGIIGAIATWWMCCRH